MTRWPDGNREDTATRYLQDAARLRRELLKGKRGEEQKEAREATKGLRWRQGKKGSLWELTEWLGEFDSVKTLLEEYPVWKRWVGFRYPVLENREKRRVGGRPPEWVGAWVGIVAGKRDEWWRGGGEGPFSSIGKELINSYGVRYIEKWVSGESVFRKMLRGSSE